MYSNNEDITIGHYNITTATPTTTATKADVIDPTPMLLAALSSTDCAETDSSEEDEEEDCEEESPALAVESDGNDEEEGAAGDEPLSLDGDESDDGDGREDEDGKSELLPLLLLPLEGSAGDGEEESVLLGAAEEFGVSDDSPAPSPIGPL